MHVVTLIDTLDLFASWSTIYIAEHENLQTRSLTQEFCVHGCILTKYMEEGLMKYMEEGLMAGKSRVGILCPWLHP